MTMAVVIVRVTKTLMGCHSVIILTPMTLMEFLCNGLMRKRTLMVCP